jgi:aquaporin Z
MKPYLIEFIGTFFLVLTIALTGNPIAIGAVLIAMIYMGGYISGGHYNPAVTLGLLLSNKIKRQPALQYMLSQFLGGIAATLTAFYLTGTYFLARPSADASYFQALLVEILFTFALVSVVHHTAATKKTKDNQYYGLAIGLTVMAAAFAGGPISGGAFNPAVGFGPYLLHPSTLGQHVTELALYTVGPFLGAALASFVYRLSDQNA